MEKKIEICLEIHRETKKSFLVSDDGQNMAWLPKSQIEHSPDPQTGDTIIFEMPEWLAIEKGFA